MAIVELSQTAPTERVTEHPHVARIENVRGGVPIIRGTRVPVRLIAQMYRTGDTVEDMLQAYPHLSAAAIYDAISYYLDHVPEMEQEIIANRIENALKETNSQMDERGFIALPPTQDG